MTIQNNFSLKKYNTFGIEAKAKQFVAVHSIEDLNTILKEHQSEPKFILGGGSNMLLTQDIQALVIHIDLKGKKNCPACNPESFMTDEQKYPFTKSDE
jgi:UDP-N-acetylmuramate dehydrogenase